MKRPVLVALLILTAVAGAGIILVQSLQERLPPQAQAALDRYVSSENAVATQPVVVQRLAHAARPSRFPLSFSAASVGGSFYFRTTRGYRNVATPNPLILSTSPVPGSATEGAQAGRALPFPPRDLWCVMLAEEGGNGRVIYLAQHEDLYNADWIVHESAGSPGDPALAGRLSEVGCDLSR